MLHVGPSATRKAAIGFLVLLVAGTLGATARLITSDHAAAAAVGPTATVRQFLVEALVNRAGFQACRYVTPVEQGRVAGSDGAPLECSAAIDRATLQLGHLTLTTSRSIDHDLTMTSRTVPGGVVVRAAHGGQSHDFWLVPAAPSERTAFDAAPTSWRINGGVLSLVPHLKR
jgi:hypothetical protein